MSRRFENSLTKPATLSKAIYCAHSPALLAAEHKATALSKAIFVCSEKDQNHLRRLGFGHKVKVVPNSIPIPTLSGAEVEAESLLYIGTFRYKPNIEGTVAILAKIWPLIRAQRPNAKADYRGETAGANPGFDPSCPAWNSPVRTEISMRFTRAQCHRMPIAGRSRNENQTS